MNKKSIRLLGVRMIISNVNFEHVGVKQPKRYDTFMNGKITYDNDKFFIELPNVRLTSCKDVSNTLYIKIKLSKEHEKMILDLEDKIVDITTENIDTWFRSKMNQDTVDEYFQSSIVFHRKFKTLFKLRIDNPSFIPDQDVIGRVVDIKLRVTSIKFLKTAFWICYDMIGCESSNPGFVGDDDETASIGGFGYDLEDGDLGPDGEDIQALRELQINRLIKEIDSTSTRLKDMRALLNDLNENNFSLSTFDAVENVLA